MAFTVVIPARYQSSRLPGKPLVDIAGKTMIERVYSQACLAGAEHVIVATDDERIASVVRGFGGDVCMTSPEHQSGTERLAEVVELKNIAPDTIVVNVQGDEPLIPPQVIKQVASNLHHYAAPMATLGVNISDPEEIFNPNAVKVVTDKSGYAMYFSRASIPWDREHFATQQVIQPVLRHIGIYAYRAGFISTYLNWQPSPLEQIESLEQLRVLWHGEKIHVDVASVTPPAGVDTPADLEAVRRHVLQES
ncbi:3-deoxy-manno-octulosonate cytidylyltransferase [Vibrio zhugei]|uniref:3-deoxy-manno-octulosonate cytidylyltransferase n=1 Tax=Vibrio zhugei TaxID=2479546 RepID=A0ABV7CEB6_9VIBR|nr:3-deoxy-manno-octulosonate cytidylyltransferase [Vibrio zhugei]